MKIKELIGTLSELQDSAEYYIDERDKQALQTAISHLETLQKVKEMGGVRKLETEIMHICDFPGSNMCDGCYNTGFNQAIDLKDVELAGKLEGLESVINKWLKSSTGKQELINKIQELILRKKEK